MTPPSISILNLSIKASGAVGVCRAVGFDGAQISSQGAKPVGIAVTAASGGSFINLAAVGTAIAESGAAIPVGAALIADAQGRLIPSTGALRVASGATPVTSSGANGAILTGGDPPEYVVADALMSASGAGEFIEVLLRR